MRIGLVGLFDKCRNVGGGEDGKGLADLANGFEWVYDATDIAVFANEFGADGCP